MTIPKDGVNFMVNTQRLPRIVLWAKKGSIERYEGKVESDVTGDIRRLNAVTAVL